MNDETPPPRLRGTPLLLARAAALTVSLGVLGILMVRAGAGCRSAETTTAVAEPPGAGPQASTGSPGANPPAQPVATAGATTAAEPVYFPGSKAWGGDGLRAQGTSSPQPAAAAATPSASAQVPAGKKPRYFGGSKSLSRVVDEDRP